MTWMPSNFTQFFPLDSTSDFKSMQYGFCEGHTDYRADPIES